MSDSRSRPAAHSIAVVGGGIIGLSIAWRLAQRGCEVALFDKASFGTEASWAGAGMLSPGGEVFEQSDLALMTVESRRMYRGFVGELERASDMGIDYQECGALELAYSAEELTMLASRAALQSAIGITSKPVDPSAIKAFWPRVDVEGLAGARFYPEDAVVNPREVVAALVEACRRLSVSVRQNSPVHAVNAAEEGVRLSGDFGEESFAAAVIAAGAWSSSIRLSGAPPLPQSEPVRGHLIVYAQPSGTCSTILRHGHTYALQRQNGLLIVGSSIEHVGFRRDIDPQILARLIGEAGRLLPHLGDTSPSDVWVGFRPASDALHVGPWHSERLYLAYGHYRNGILLAPVTAHRLADEITSSLGMQ